MRTFIAFSLTMCAIIVACAPERTSPVQGAWQLVALTYVENNSLVGDVPGKWTVRNIKIWSEDYVVFVGQFESDTKVIDTYGGGHYKLQGNRYEEAIEYHGLSSAVGDTFKMILEIVNDTLVQTWPVLDNGEIDKRNYRQEQYVRLD
jgi:hypothetical protein